MLKTNLSYKILFSFALVLTLYFCMGSFSAYAQSAVLAASDDDAEEAEYDPAPLIDVLRKSSSEEQTVSKTVYLKFKQDIADIINDYKFALNDFQRTSDQDQAAPNFYDFIVDVLGERVVSETLASKVRLQMAGTTTDMITGKKKAIDSSSASDDNPMAGTYIANEADLWKSFNQIFCIPESVNATAECKAKKGTVKPPYENFIDFFISNGTWSTTRVIDALSFARRFYAGGSDRILLGQGMPDAGSFVVDQGGVAKANLRMAILNDLAARRAPTSQSTDAATKLLLGVFTVTDEVESLNYKTVCDKDADVTLTSSYVCNYTAQGDASGTRLISQAALDRILQYDFMMSSDFYNKINSAAYTATGSLDKVQVTLKAQQVAQDYRELRLLQMKTAAVAMNIMNK